MTTLEIPADVDLRDLVSSPGRIVSVYFRRPLPDESTAARRRAVVARLAEQGASAATLRAVDDVLCDVRPGTGAVALFVEDHERDGHPGVVPALVTMPGASMPDFAGFATLPSLLPLLAWRQTAPAHVVAVTGPDGTEIETHPAGGGEPHVLHAASDPDAVAQALLDSGARILVLGGAHPAERFTDALPPWIRHEIDVRPIPGGSQRQHAEFVRVAVAGAVEAATHALLTELAGQRRPHGLAVQGAPAVLHALARGRVRTLLVTDSPADERIAWFGEKAGELSGHRAELERSGAAVRPGRLVDAAVRAAILTGADIRVLRPRTPGAPEQGLGALCRFQ